MGEHAEVIWQKIVPLIEAEGLEVEDVEWKEGPRKGFLRIFIDKPGGVTSSDCQRAARIAGPALDLIEIFSRAYALEVSSPGLFRPLKKASHYAKYKGSKIKLTFLDGNKIRTVRGNLVDFRDETVFVEMKSGTLEVALDDIKKANLDPELG